MATDSDYCKKHSQQRREMTLAGSVVGAALIGLATPSVVPMAVGALIGGFLASHMKDTPENKG